MLLSKKEDKILTILLKSLQVCVCVRERNREKEEVCVSQKEEACVS